MGVGRASFSLWLPAELSFCRIGCLGHLKEVGLLYYLVGFFVVHVQINPRIPFFPLSEVF